MKAFNNCIIPDKNHAPNDEDFSITFLYEYIDDDYSMSNWLPEASSSLDGSSSDNQGDKSSLADASEIANAKVYLDADPIAGTRPHVSEEAKKYSDSTKILIENHPLSVMVSKSLV